MTTLSKLAEALVWPHRVEWADEDGDGFTFHCHAEDYSHAQEQCINAEPTCNILATQRVLL